MAEAEAARPEPPEDDKPKPAPAPAPAKAEPGTGDIQAELVVLGSGPGGYTAAFRAADLGLKVVLVERYPTLGGVCLNVGCIPSKALLHAAKVIAEAREMAEHGLTFGKPEIDLDKLADWKDGVVSRLTGGLAGLAKQSKVQVVQGVGKFTSPNQLEVATDSGKKTIGFGQAIIAAGSQPIFLPFIPRDDPRVMDSTGALELEDIPERLLVLGGGIIGLEMATVYHELGSKITVVELMDQLIPGADPDIIRPLHKRIEGALREHLPRHQGDRRQGRQKRPRGQLRGAEGAEVGHLRQGAGRGRQAAERQGDRGGRRGRHGRRAGLHPGRPAAADQRPPHLRDRRRGRPADARPQGDPRGQGRGRGRRRPQESASMPSASPRSPTPTPRSPGPA